MRPPHSPEPPALIVFVNLRKSHLEHRAAIEAAHRLGYGVALIADSVPEALPGAVVRETHRIDIEDDAAVDAAVDAIAGRHAVAGVVPWSDAGVTSASRIAARLGLPGLPPAAAGNARNKLLMRRTLADRPDLMPRFAEVLAWDDAMRAAREIGFPAVLKPTSGSGSKGIFLLGGEADLRPAFDALMRLTQPSVNKVFRRHPGQLIFEEFLEGTEHSVEGFVHRGRVSVAGVTDKRTTEPFRLELAHVHPSALPQEKIDAVLELTDAVVRGLRLDDCAFHLECIIGPRGARLVEVAARVGGDHITSHLVGLATGVPFYENVIRVATGRPPLLPRLPVLFAGSYKIIAARAGTLTGWSGLNDALDTSGIKHLVIERGLGTKIRLPPEHYSSSVLGTLIAVEASADAVWRTLENAAAAVQVEITE